MKARGFENCDVHRAMECLKNFAVSLVPTRQKYFHLGQELREKYRKTPKWRRIKRFLLGRRLARTDIAHNLVCDAIKEAMWFRTEIRDKPRPWLIGQLEDFAWWAETADNGPGVLIGDKVRLVREAIAYLKGAKEPA